MGKKETRINRLVEILQQRQGMTVKELASYFDVSEMTIRRDMELLKKENVILAIPGAAVYNSNNDNYSIVDATVTNVREKDRIGRYAAGLVEENDCLIIDNGTTTEQLAAHIPASLSATVLTCNLNIINTLAQKPKISIICGGGYYHGDTGMFESPESISLIQKSRATKVFCSAAGVHQTMGVTCMNSYEVSTKRAIMQSGAKRILLIDSTKFGIVRSCYISDLSNYDMIVTDSGISRETREKLEAMDLDLVVV